MQILILSSLQMHLQWRLPSNGAMSSQRLERYLKISTASWNLKNVTGPYVKAVTPGRQFDPGTAGPSHVPIFMSACHQPLPSLCHQIAIISVALCRLQRLQARVTDLFDGINSFRRNRGVLFVALHRGWLQTLALSCAFVLRGWRTPRLNCRPSTCGISSIAHCHRLKYHDKTLCYSWCDHGHRLTFRADGTPRMTHIRQRGAGMGLLRLVCDSR